MILLVFTEQRIELVCSVDRSVTLKYLPQSDEDQKAGKPRIRETRRPNRWLRAEQVESIGPDALRVVVRALNSDEQFACTGGMVGLNPDNYGRSTHLASLTAVCSVRGPGIDALNPGEVAQAVARIPLTQRAALGEWVLNESCGYSDPFDDGE